MFLKASMVTNIITIFTGLAHLIHVQAGHEAGCFNRNLTRGSHFYQKNFSLDSLTKDFECHFKICKVLDYVTKLQKIYFS